MELKKIAAQLMRVTPLVRPSPAQATAPALSWDSYVKQSEPLVPHSLATPVTTRIVEADLKVRLQATPAGSNARMVGTLRGQVTVSHGAILKALNEHLPSSPDLHFQGVYYDSQRGEYRVLGEKILSTKLKFLNPSFTLRFRPDGMGRFRAEAESSADWLVKLLNGMLGALPFEHTRLPTAQDSLRQKLDASLDRNLFTLSHPNGQMVIDLVPRFRVPLGQNTILELENYDGGRAARFNGNGDLVIDLQPGHFKGNVGRPDPSQPAAMNPVQADLHVRIAIAPGNNGSLQAESLVDGQLLGHLSAGELKALGEKLSPAIGRFASSADIRLQDLKLYSRYGGAQNLQNRMEADLEMDINHGEVRLSGHVHGDEPDYRNWRVGGDHIIVSTGVAPSSPPSKVMIAHSNGHLQTQVSEPPAPTFMPRFSPNHLELIVDGPAYVAALRKAINGARESVTVESFGFEGSSQPQAIMRALLNRAAGLVEDGDVLRSDGSGGIQVKILADKDLWYSVLWPEEVVRYLNHCQEPGWEARTLADIDAKRGPYAAISDDQAYQLRTAYAWAKTYVRELLEGTGPFARLTPAERDRALDRSARHVEVRQTGHHPVQSDHRKVTIIDGSEGYTGGMNMGDWNLVKAHDVMVRVHGPAVRDMQEHFIHAWNESGEAISVGERRRLLKSGASLKVQAGGNARTAVLVTDADRNDIEQVILRHIDMAKKQINIEHVFFAYAPVTDRLAAAVRRGVDVNVILPVPEETVGDLDGSKPFLFANMDAALQLKAAATSPASGSVRIAFYPRTMHTKAMTFDGRATVVGSANLDQRGMHGALRNFLYNRELSLLVEDPDFTADFERRIMGADRKQARSWETVLKQMQDQYGGPDGLQREIEKRRGKERLY